LSITGLKSSSVAVLYFWHVTLSPSLVPNILKDNAVPIFRVSQSMKDCFILKMKARWSFKMLEAIHSTTQHHIPKDLSLQQHHYGNLKAYKLGYFF